MPLNGGERLDYEGELRPVMERLWAKDVFNDRHAALDCTRILIGLMEYKRLSHDVVTPQVLSLATLSVRHFLESGDLDHLEELKDIADCLPELGKVVITQTAGGADSLRRALRVDTCVEAAKDIAKRIGEKDSLVIALGGSGILPSIQTAICRDEMESTATEIYPVRFSVQRMQDEYPQVNRSELDHLQQRADGKALVVFDEAVALGDTMKRALSYFESALERSDIVPVWSWDIMGRGEAAWPFPEQNPS